MMKQPENYPKYLEEALSQIQEMQDKNSSEYHNVIVEFIDYLISLEGKEDFDCIKYAFLCLHYLENVCRVNRFTKQKYIVTAAIDRFAAMTYEYSQKLVKESNG